MVTTETPRVFFSNNAIPPLNQRFPLLRFPENGNWPEAFFLFSSRAGRESLCYVLGAYRSCHDQHSSILWFQNTRLLHLATKLHPPPNPPPQHCRFAVLARLRQLACIFFFLGGSLVMLPLLRHLKSPPPTAFHSLMLGAFFLTFLLFDPRFPSSPSNLTETLLYSILRLPP